MATLIMIVVLTVLLTAMYMRMMVVLRARSIERMDEGVNTVIQQVTNLLTSDSRVLNAAADTIADSDDFSIDSLRQTVTAFNPLLGTMDMYIVLPDDTVIRPDGTVIDGTGMISFDELAPMGEHLSGRSFSNLYQTQVLRHYVPIVDNGETVGILYGLTILEDMQESMNIGNLFNSKASVYIIDIETGDFIMDTYHPNLGNISDHSIKDLEERIAHHETGYLRYYSTFSDQWMYVYYAPANVSEWAIAVTVPEKDTLANMFAIQRIFMFIGVLMAIAVAVYYTWVHRNARHETERAVEKAVLEEKLQKAEAAERAKTMFLSNMSHDIRTPMNAIIGFTTLAQANIEKSEKVQEYLSKILSSGNHLLSLINDILDMSRIESGRLHIEEKECSVSDIFRDMRNILQTQMQAKQLNFFMDTLDVIDEDIYCDKLHINQVLLNLLSNAIKFTPAGGNVSLTIRQKPGAPEGYGSYEIRVKDTGIGMSKEFAQHVFEPFEREQTSTVSGIQGTGLGMAISKSIIDAMGGKIAVETEQGKGTEYIIELEFRLQTEHVVVTTIKELEGMHALVVDDSFDTCDSVTKMLAKIGMRSEWTLHGKEAVLRAIQAKEMGDEFYVYIIDWAMPDMSGIEIVRQIRADIGDSVPIIILTAYDWSLFEEEAREAGVTAFCNKPLFLSELRDTLVSVIDHSQIPETKSAIPMPEKNLAGKRFLLVEDNEFNREIAQELLEEAGFEIDTAEDGTYAVEKVKNAKPGEIDLILMDVQMPVMNGYDATRAIRALEDKRLSSIPIIAMTANAFEEDKKMALDSGMNAFVTKPIDVEKLMEAINGILSQKE